MRGHALVVVVLVACGAEVPLETGTDDQAIVNGEVDTGDPAVVSVGGFCTGTLVTPKTVLTAHHCLGSGSTPNFEVYFGTRHGDSAGTYIRAVHQARNPSGGPGRGDLAMLTLASVRRDGRERRRRRRQAQGDGAARARRRRGHVRVQ